MSELELQLLKRMIAYLERQQGLTREDQELREMREMLMALELTDRIQDQAAESRPRGWLGQLDWAKLLPWLLLLAVFVAAIIATLLGVEIPGVLP